jgi:hypothetical protein
MEFALPPPGSSEALAPTRARARGEHTQWTASEDALLAQLLAESDDWSYISGKFPNRTAKQVLAHWRKVADPTIIRGSWTAPEDAAIMNWVAANGATRWAALASQLPGRIAKQCRERWVNHLDPAISKDAWTPEEDDVITAAIRQHGQKWALIARLLPGRSDNQVKNRWNCQLKRKTDQNAPLDQDHFRETLAALIRRGHSGIDGEIQDGFASNIQLSMDQIQALVKLATLQAGGADAATDDGQLRGPPEDPLQ